MNSTNIVKALLELRGRHNDQTILDLLHVAELLNYQPGLLLTEQLLLALRVHPTNVSRRIHSLHSRGLIDVTRRAGGYSVHYIKLEVP